jgi:hypothetical protein
VDLLLSSDVDQFAQEENVLCWEEQHLEGGGYDRTLGYRGIQVRH